MMRALGISAFVALIADQASKYTVIHGMELARVRAIDVFPPLLNFRYGENRGINFGLFDQASGQSWSLIALAVFVCLAVLWWLRRNPQTWLTAVCGGFLIGGAMGNVVDRLYYGYVLDFLNMSCCGITNPFVFNVADIFIFVGAIGIVFLANDGSPRKKAS